MVLVTVQIVTFNNATTIEQCLKSVLQQEGVSFSVFVLDNASDDQTPHLVSALNVPIIQNNHNSGYAAAHNQLLLCSDAPYVLTLNPDVCLEPDFLAQMLSAIEADARIGSAAGCLLRVDQLGETAQVVDSAGLFMRRNRRQGLRAEGLPVAQRPRESARIFGPDGAAAFYRRAMLQDIRVNNEVFDADFFLHKEDIDVCWRAKLRGWNSVYVPDAVGYHIRTFRPGQRHQVNDALRYYGVRNRYLLILKNDDWSSLLRSGLHMLVYELSILLYILLFERASLRALWSVWQMRDRIFAQRRVIQQQRTVTPAEMQRWFQDD